MPGLRIYSSAQTISKNLNRADFVSYQTLYNGQSVDPTEKETIADVACWKDTSTGKEYALVCLPESGSGSGIAVVEVSDPIDADYIKTIRYPGANPSEENARNTPADVKVFDDIAFVAQNSQYTYWVELDVALESQNLGNPTAGVHTGDFGGTRIHNLFANADHELLFLSDFIGDEDILVYDISGLPNSDPDQVGTIPQYLTGIGSRSHDLYAQTLTSTTGRVYDATLTSITASNYTWNGSTFSVGTQLAHEFNPRRGESPGAFSTVISPETERVIHGTWIGQDSDYLFATVEGNSGSNAIGTWVSTGAVQYQRGNHLYVWDINPYNPSADGNGYRYPIRQVYEVRENTEDGHFASSYFSNLSSEKCNSIHNIVTRANGATEMAYISYYTKGIRVLDATNPENMSEIAYYDVSGVAEYVYPVFNGTWGVDPFLPSGSVLGSSSDGLYVFRKPGTFSGLINVDTEWTDDIEVSGDVTVASGVTLTIQSGVIVNFLNGDDQSGGEDDTKSELIINGRLNADNVTFQSVNSTKGGWWGIIFADGCNSSSYLEDCVIEDGYYGVQTYENITINDTEFNNIDFAGVNVLGEAEPTVTDCKIQADAIGIYIYRGSGTYNHISFEWPYTESVRSGVYQQIMAPITKTPLLSMSPIRIWMFLLQAIII